MSLLTLDGGDVLDGGVPLGQVVCAREGHINAVEEPQQVSRLGWPTRALALVIALHIRRHHASVRAGNLQTMPGLEAIRTDFVSRVPEGSWNSQWLRMWEGQAVPDCGPPTVAWLYLALASDEHRLEVGQRAPD